MGQITAARAHGEKRAYEIVSKHDIVRAPVPVREIAIAEGCDVSSMVLKDELSGMAFIRDGRKIIVVNGRHHPNRQRFTIAHELGHHIIHFTMLSSGVHVDKGVLRRDPNSSEGFDKREIEANAFAAALLMPKQLMLQYIPQSIDLEDEPAVANLAKRFAVSPVALTNRILNLNL